MLQRLPAESSYLWGYSASGNGIRAAYYLYSVYFLHHYSAEYEYTIRPTIRAK